MLAEFTGSHIPFSGAIRATSWGSGLSWPRGWVSSGSGKQLEQMCRLAEELSLFGKQCWKLEPRVRVRGEAEGKQDQESEEALTRRC